ncbi:hypothetical protein ACWGK1_02270 [Streptomyces wedmorensis]
MTTQRDALRREAVEHLAADGQVPADLAAAVRIADMMEMAAAQPKAPAFTKSYLTPDLMGGSLVALFLGCSQDFRHILRVIDDGNCKRSTTPDSRLAGPGALCLHGLDEAMKQIPPDMAQQYAEELAEFTTTVAVAGRRICDGGRNCPQKKVQPQE